MPYEADYQDLWQNYDPDGDPIGRLMNKLIGQQQMIQSTVQEVRENLEGDIEYNRSQITQTADEIRQEVFQRVEDSEGILKGDYESLISQTAQEIRLDVSAMEAGLGDRIALTESSIVQTASDIRLEVTSLVELLDGRISESYSLIEQSINAIDLRVGSVENDFVVLENGQTDLQTRLDSAEVKITPTNIVSTVRSSTAYSSDLSGKVGTNEIISRINQTAESVSIHASRINLAGAVTFNDLDSSTRSTINGKASSNDVTTIIGNTITTSYIEAREIASVGRTLYLGGRNTTGTKSIIFSSGISIDGADLDLHLNAARVNLNGQVYINGSQFDGTARFG